MDDVRHKHDCLIATAIAEEWHAICRLFRDVYPPSDQLLSVNARTLDAHAWILRLTCTIIYAICPLLVHSAPVTLSITYTTANSGLPNNHITSLAESRDGTLWIGTEGGLARLDKDGRWQTYKGFKVNALALGVDGTLWIGTNGGLSGLDKDGHWRTDDGRPSDQVNALALDSNGALWIGTVAGLVQLDKEGIWHKFRMGDTERSDAGYIAALATGPDGALWIGKTLVMDARGELMRLDKEGHWQSFTTPSHLYNDVTALVVGLDGVVWIGTIAKGGAVLAGNGLTRLDKDGRFQSYTNANTHGSLPDDRVLALAQAADGSLWTGTEGGLARLDVNGRWHTYGTSEDGIGGLLGAHVKALTTSADGALWIGTNGGLSRLGQGGPWRIYSKNQTDGWPDDRITALALGAHDSLWIGTGSLDEKKPDYVPLYMSDFGGPLIRLKGDDGWQTDRKNITVFDKSLGGISFYGITALATGADGTVWIGTSAGLQQFDAKGDLTTYTNASTKSGLPVGPILALAVDINGTCWIGTKSGLIGLDKNGEWRTYSASKNLGTIVGPVNTLALDADSTLWVGTGSGLLRVASNGRSQIYTKSGTNGGLPDDQIMALVLGAGALWIGTDRGLARLDKDGHWQNYTITTSKNGQPDDRTQAPAPQLERGDIGSSQPGSLDERIGLPDDRVQALAIGADGALWIGTGRGLARLDKEGHWQNYTATNTGGLLPNDNISALVSTPEGGLWIGTERGLTFFRHPTIPTHRIVDVIGGNARVTQRVQSVEVVAFDSSYRTEPSLFHYAWRMTESGRLVNPRDPEIRTKFPFFTATFDHDGEYQLQVNAIDRYGEWSAPRLINFHVTLPKLDSANRHQWIFDLDSSDIESFDLVESTVRLGGFELKGADALARKDGATITLTVPSEVVTRLREGFYTAEILERGNLKAKIRLAKDEVELKLFRPFKKSYALIIAISNYPSTSGYRILPDAVKQAKALEFLLRSQGFDLLPSLYDADATKANIDKALLAARATGDDRLFIYFGGHGDDMTTFDGKPYGFLVPFDGRSKDLPSTAIPIADLRNRYAPILKAKQVFFALDSCQSGLAISRGDLPREETRERAISDIESMSSEPGRVFMTAGSGGQPALDINGGIFTRALIDGINGAADQPKNGAITFYKLYEYVRGRVADEARGLGIIQEPDVDVMGRGRWVFVTDPSLLK